MHKKLTQEEVQLRLGLTLLFGSIAAAIWLTW